MQLSRRAFMQTGAGAGVAAALGTPVAAAAAARKPRAGAALRVGIIGAGGRTPPLEA